MKDLRRLTEALHASRHRQGERGVMLRDCPFHGEAAFEREARAIAWLVRVGIGRRP